MQRILLVEDNAMNRDLISRRLKRRGYDVSLAVDGAEGVERATADLPDLIVMDMGLPVLDGYEASRMLKDAEVTRRIPIIGLSAHAMSGDARKALSAGCDDYDTKPVEWPRLLGKISALLERAQAENAEAAVETTVLPKSDKDPNAAHLLVVDDSALHREMLSGRLASLGYTFDLAADAASALEQLERGSFDALLLDVTLPSTHGQPLLERIRSDDRFTDLPILMLTTIDATGSAVGCLSTGAEDFVPQPFLAEVLAARLGGCLERVRLRRQNKSLEEKLGQEKRRSEHLLGHILPAELIEELRQTRKVVPRRHDDAVVMFSGVAGFPQLSDHLDPQDAVRRLQKLIAMFEEIAQQHRLLKVKTVGDAFMSAAGLFEPGTGSALAAVRCGLEMRDAAARLEAEWPVRIGLHRGPVVAGVVGHPKYQFDLWGATVQTAARVERTAAAGAVHASEAVWADVSAHCRGQQLGEAQLKGGGAVKIYRVDSVSAG